MVCHYQLIIFHIDSYNYLLFYAQINLKLIVLDMISPHFAFFLSFADLEIVDKRTINDIAEWR